MKSAQYVDFFSFIVIFWSMNMGQEAAILHPQTTSLKKLPLAVFLSSDRQFGNSIIHTL
jgi:hypothetical protein